VDRDELLEKAGMRVVDGLPSDKELQRDGVEVHCEDKRQSPTPAPLADTLPAPEVKEGALAEERMRAVEELENLNETKLAEEENTKAETGKCPRCGKDEGWDNLPMDTDLPNPLVSVALQAEEHPRCRGQAMPRLRAYRLRPWGLPYNRVVHYRYCLDKSCHQLEASRHGRSSHHRRRRSGRSHTERRRRPSKRPENRSHRGDRGASSG